MRGGVAAAKPAAPVPTRKRRRETGNESGPSVGGFRLSDFGLSSTLASSSRWRSPRAFSYAIGPCNAFANPNPRRFVGCDRARLRFLESASGFRCAASERGAGAAWIGRGAGPVERLLGPRASRRYSAVAVTSATKPWAATRRSWVRSRRTPEPDQRPSKILSGIRVRTSRKVVRWICLQRVHRIAAGIVPPDATVRLLEGQDDKSRR